MVGKASLNFDEWNEELATELDLARQQGKHPYPLTKEEEIKIAETISAYPDITEVRDELVWFI